MINFENEIKILEIKESEMEKAISKFQEKEELNSEIEQNNLRMRINLLESQEQLDQLRERHEFERIERNSLMVSFDHERQILEETIDCLRQDRDETIFNLKSRCEWLQETLSKLTEEKEKLESEIYEARHKPNIETIIENEDAENKNVTEQVSEETTVETSGEKENIPVAEFTEDITDTNLTEQTTNNTTESNFDNDNLMLMSELTRSKKDNSKLVKALKKARDHIIYQDSLIQELQEALQSEETETSELTALRREIDHLRSQILIN